MIVGIDLGTTNSAIAVWRDGRPELIPNSLGHRLTPSAVSVGDDGSFLVGLPARERQSTHPGRTATSFKRYMGSFREIRLGERDFQPEELSALVLRELVASAEAALGESIREAVITVPAYFNDKQRKATRRAGELAGLKVERLINEPTAAALAYGIDRLEAESKFLVFDLGGGTFDVSILEIFEGVVEVRSSTGDNRLGGEDFNEILVEAFLRNCGNKIQQRSRRDPVLRERLREAAERARRVLTNQPSTTMSMVWHDEKIDLEVPSEAFSEWSAPLINRLREPVIRALRDSGLRSEDLTEIVLVGGGTRMPVVRQAITRMFGRFPAHGVNPDEAVAVGAAIQAGLKSRNADLKELVMTDVCPFSLGVEAGEKGPTGTVRTGLFVPVIERNTVIPASRVKTFFPLEDGQRELKLRIFQGESRWVKDNIPLGSLSVDLPPGPAGKAQVDVRFSYDINGLLEVDVRVPSTGLTHQLVIVGDEDNVPTDLAVRRASLAQLKRHPREDDANQQALARAGRCFEFALGDQRELIGTWIAAFESALDTQDPLTVTRARERLMEGLDAIEGTTWL